MPEKQISEKQITVSNRPDSISVPLYAAGLVVSFCGTLAANAALPMPDVDWLTKTILLTVLGFLFSYGCRRFQIPVRQIETAFLLLLMLAAVGVLSGAVDWAQFLPIGSENANLRLEALLAWAATLWSWTLLTDNRVLMAAVPAMATLGLAATLDLNNPVLACFGVFVVAVIFLLIHQNYLLNQARATAQQRALEAGNARPILIAQGIQTAVCAVGVLLVGMVVIIPAQASFSRLSLGGAIRQLANLGKGNASGGTNSMLRYSDAESFAIGTGDGWSSSPEVLLHVAPSDGREHLWRGRTYDRYTGEGWQSSLQNDLEPLRELNSADSGYRLQCAVPLALTPGDLGASAAQAARGLITTHVTLRGESEQFYYAGNPRRITFNGRRTGLRHGGLELCRDGRLDLADHGAFLRDYEVDSTLTLDPALPDDQARLRQTGTNYPATIRHLYLNGLASAVTGDDDLAFFQEMTGDALQVLPASQHDPLDEALAIRDWVSQRCVYSLAVPPLTPGADHVHEFLGSTRRGYCDMFASSMAVLCRTAGIPARVCTGFASGQRDDTGFDLRGEDKHAWVEVYFVHFGWIPFDPTAGSRSDGSVPGALAPASPFAWLHWGHGTGAQRAIPGLLLAVIALLLGYVFKTEVLDRRRASRRVPTRREAAEQAQAARRTALEQHYACMIHLIAALGLPRRASETPAEFAARAVPFLAACSQETGIVLDETLVRTLTADFILICYGDNAAASPGESSWALPLAVFSRAVRQARWRAFWRRGVESWKHLGSIQWIRSSTRIR